ncbi:MAG: class I SAM-dependent methyltransferase [Caldilineaceae bacterium]
MQPIEIAQSYDQIAERWSSDDFPRANGIAQHERAIAFVQQKRYALDIGCGSSGRIIDLLLRHSFAVEGVDISPRMIELARARHPAIPFHLADICQWELPRQYNLISAWDSIWHLPLTAQEPVMQKLMAGLAPGGILIYTTAGLDAPTAKVDAAMGVPVYYGVLGIPHTLALIDACGCVCRHLEYDQYPELHLYLIVQKL